MSPFTSVFRFRDEQGHIRYGEAGQSSHHSKSTLTGSLVPVFRGDFPWDESFALTGEHKRVAEVGSTSLISRYSGCFQELTRALENQVLCPLPNTPIFLCVGLNYKQHANEAKVIRGHLWVTLFY